MTRKSLLAASLLGVALLGSALADEELYDDKYDHIDVEAVLGNERHRNQYLTCFLGTKPCLTDDAKFFKDKFAEALVTKCRKCTEKQKHFFELTVDYFTTHEPDTWHEILATSIERIQKQRA